MHSGQWLKQVLLSRLEQLNVAMYLALTAVTY